MRGLCIAVAVAATAVRVVAATKDVSATYGQPATLWITNDDFAGITVAAGTGSVQVHTPSPIVQQAL
jgi:hypothetical protein